MSDLQNRIESLLEMAIELPPEERSSFLASECSDESVRAEVESLLGAYEEADGFIDSLVDSVVAPLWNDWADQTDEEDPLQIVGRDVGRYAVLERVGGGSMGIVYKATDKVLNRTVALKFLSPLLTSTKEAKERFLREAQTASSLDHPNLATIYEIDTAAAGQALTPLRYIAMGFYDGETLQEIIQRGPVSVERALDFATQILCGLAAAHDAGVVHRDVKPANVIVTSGGTLKLVDFGIARATSDAALTNPGRRIGTAAYMSPEQALGKEVDHRSDLWSVGVILYEMLTGSRAFHRATETSTLYAIVHEDPRGVRAIRPDVPAGIEAVIERCLTKDAKLRYQKAGALLKDLEAVRKGEQIQALRPAATRDRAVAVLPFESLGRSASTAFTKGIHADILTRLSAVRDLRVISRTTVQQYEQKTKSIRDIGREIGACWIVEGEVSESSGRVRINVRLIEAESDRQLWAEDFRRELSADKLFEIQAEITRQVATALSATLSHGEAQRISSKPTQDLLAYRLCAQGRRRLDQRTQSGMSKAVDYFRQATHQDPGFALAWAGLADALALLYDYGYAPVSHLRQAEAAVQRAIEIDPDLAQAHASLGLIHSNRRRGPDAITALQRAVALQPSYAEAHNWLSWNFQLLGLAEEALRNAQRAVELDPLSPEAVSNLALSSLHLGLWEQALSESRRAAELQPDWSTTHFYEALALQGLGDHRSAADVLDGVEAAWAGVGPQTTRCLALLSVNESSEADAFLGECLAIEEYFAAGILHAAMGEIEAAFDCLFRVNDWDDWPTLAVHHLYADVLSPLRRDARWQAIKRRVQRARGTKVPEDPDSDAPAPSQVSPQERWPARTASIAVLPFTSIGSDSTRTYAEGIHEDLLTTMSRLDGLHVISRTSVMRYKETAISLPQVGAALNAEWVVEGSVQQTDSQLRVRASLVEARSDRRVWANDYRCELTSANLFDLQEDITREIANVIQARLSPSQMRRVEHRPTDKLEAYQFYVRGRGRLHERSEHAMKEAIRLFQSAIEIDSNYGLAWAGLADATCLLNYYAYEVPSDIPAPLDAAQRAVDLSPEVGEVHCSLGIAQSLNYQGAAAIRSLTKAIELTPSYAEAYVWLSWLYVLTGRPEKSLEPAKTSVDLNPFSPPNRSFLALSHLATGRHAQALAEAKRAREIEPRYRYAHYLEAVAYYHLGDVSNALASIEMLGSRNAPPHGTPSALAVMALHMTTLVKAKRRDEAQSFLERLENNDLESNFSKGLISAALGNVDDAIRQFRSIDRWDPMAVDHMRYLFPDVLAPVRSSPSYGEIMAAIEKDWH